MGSAPHSNADGHHEIHIIPLKVYIGILVTLLFLTVITVAAARVDFGHLNPLIAFAIATAKASLVLGYFMHLKYDDKMYLVVFLLAVFFLVVMYLFSILDIFTRVLYHNIL